MKPIITTIIFIGVVIFAFFCGTQANRWPDPTAERQIAVIQKVLDRCPTIKDIQQRIGAKEDGIVGPNTISLWKKAINNQYAIESFNRMAGDTK